VKLRSLSAKLRPAITAGPVRLCAAIGALSAFTPAEADQAQYSCVRHRYVNIATGIDASSRGDSAHPWKTIDYADDNGGLVAGDCVHVAAGIYPQPDTLEFSHGGNANTPTGYVAWIGAPNHATQIKANAAMGYLISFAANYIVVDGFDVNGNGDAKTGDYVIGLNNRVGGPGHHLQILNNWVHDAAGGGIGLTWTDYFTIKGNVIWNVAHLSGYQESGIAIWEPHAINGFTPTLATDKAPFHIVISNNIIHDVFETWRTNDHTDGNGIILDSYNQKPYAYKTLIQSNLIYNNGGRGIHVFDSGNATVTNNTTYNNLLDQGLQGTWRGELSCQECHDVIWQNNITWAIVGPSPYRQYNTAVLDRSESRSKNPNITWSHNLTFNGVAGRTSLNMDSTTGFATNNKAGVDPKLKNAPGRNFHPLSGSPVIGAGISTPSYPPTNLDAKLMARQPNIGAY
jgi:parallel beta-helix repeat protein